MPRAPRSTITVRCPDYSQTITTKTTYSNVTRANLLKTAFTNAGAAAGSMQTFKTAANLGYTGMASDGSGESHESSWSGGMVDVFADNLATYEKGVSQTITQAGASGTLEPGETAECYFVYGEVHLKVGAAPLLPAASGGCSAAPLQPSHAALNPSHTCLPIGAGGLHRHRRVPVRQGRRHLLDRQHPRPGARAGGPQERAGRWWCCRGCLVARGAVAWDDLANRPLSLLRSTRWAPSPAWRPPSLSTTRPGSVSG